MSRAVETTLLHEGPVFSVERCRFRDDDGGPEVVRDVVRHPGAVVILPVTDDGRVVLIRNLRRAVGRVLWELPAGTLDRAEAPAAAAARELEEETGYRAASIVPLGRFYASPGFLDELLHVFVARDLVFVGQRLEPGETIEVETVTPERIDAMLDAGELLDGKTIAALLWWRRGTAA